MLKNLVKKRNLILAIFTGVLTLMWILFLVLGDYPDKVTLLVIAPILPIMIYLFVRVMFIVIGKNASVKVIKIYVCFFLIAGVFGGIVSIVEFLTGFPNDFSPTIAACMGLVVGILDVAKKYIDTDPDDNVNN